MAQTNAIWDPLEYTLDQIARHKIPIEQICRAVKREHRTAVKEYLAGKSPCKHFKIGGTILSIVQDIVDARMSEQRQVEEPRELHCAPRHPGIPGRECTILRLSRGRFLELCRLSQPELVDALGEETAKANDEENSGEENDIEPDLDIREWPRLNPPALRGIAKEFVELATRSSEADPAAVLVIFLSRFGIEIGTDPHIMIGDKRHSARLFAVIVGSSSKARKGTSADPVRRL